MDGRGCNAKDLRSLPDIDQIAVDNGGGFRVIAWNLPRASQASDPTDVEAMATGGGLTLAIEDSGNDFIGMQLRETANKINRILVGSQAPLAGTGAVQFDPAQQAGAPAQTQMELILAARSPDHYFLKYRAQQLLLVACRGCGGVPDTTKVRTEREDCIAVSGIE